MMAKPDLREDAQHSASEHKEIDEMLTELYEMDFASTGWLTRFRTMKHRYLHHIDEEEEEMFPAAEDGLSQARKEEIAEIFAKEKPKEKAKAVTRSRAEIARSPHGSRSGIPVRGRSPERFDSLSAMRR